MQKSLMQISNQLSVEIRINENTMVRICVSVNNNCHCVTYGCLMTMAVTSSTGSQLMGRLFFVNISRAKKPKT